MSFRWRILALEHLRALCLAFIDSDDPVSILVVLLLMQSVRSGKFIAFSDFFLSVCTASGIVVVEHNTAFLSEESVHDHLNRVPLTNDCLNL